MQRMSIFFWSAWYFSAILDLQKGKRGRYYIDGRVGLLQTRCTSSTPLVGKERIFFYSVECLLCANSGHLDLNRRIIFCAIPNIQYILEPTLSPYFLAAAYCQPRNSDIYSEYRLQFSSYSCREDPSQKSRYQGV